MKISTKGLFVIVLIIMSFVAVPVVFAGAEAHNNKGYQNNDSGKPDFPDINDCNEFVEGDVTWVSTDSGVIEVTYEDDDEVEIKIIVNGVPLYLGVTDEDYVEINYRISPNDKYVACDITINDGSIVVLR